jgi:antitoxin component YwqK of YwqJK toxin-antitoxin module
VHQGCALSLRSDGTALWHGPYRLRSGSATVLEGEYVDNKKQGTWREYFANGKKRSEGAYDYDRPTGEHRRWDEKGHLLAVSHYRAGVSDGVQTTFFENGQKQSEASFELGKQIGVNSEWYADGTRKSECHYEADQMHGRCTRWHANGKVALEGEFERGQRKGKLTTWHDNGQVQNVGFYEQGLLAGAWSEFHSNGKRRVQGTYVAGKKQGTWTQWDESGTRRLVEEYESDFKLESEAFDAAGRPVVEAVPAGLRQCDRAPELELSGGVSLSSLRGKKPVLILWTPPPEPFLTTLRRWYEKHKADVEVVLFCSVYYGDAASRADPAATCRMDGFPVRIVATSMAGREPPPKDTVAWRAGRAIAYVIDAEGKIAYRGANLRDLPSKLEQLLASRSPCSPR